MTGLPASGRTTPAVLAQRRRVSRRAGLSANSESARGPGHLQSGSVASQLVSSEGCPTARNAHDECLASAASRRAAARLVGPEHAEAFDAVPYFWSNLTSSCRCWMCQRITTLSRSSKAIRTPGSSSALTHGGRTIAVLGTIPGWVHAYREAIEKRAEFPPSRPD